LSYVLVYESYVNDSDVLSSYKVLAVSVKDDFKAIVEDHFKRNYLEKRAFGLWQGGASPYPYMITFRGKIIARYSVVDIGEYKFFVKPDPEEYDDIDNAIDF